MGVCFYLQSKNAHPFNANMFETEKKFCKLYTKGKMGSVQKSHIHVSTCAVYTVHTYSLSPSSVLWLSLILFSNHHVPQSGTVLKFSHHNAWNQYATLINKSMNMNHFSKLQCSFWRNAKAQSPHMQLHICSFIVCVSRQWIWIVCQLVKR